MDEGRCAFEGLHQVRLDGIFHQDRQSAGDTQVFGCDSLALSVRCHDHCAQAVAHVCQPGGQRQDRHDLTGNGDVVARPVLKALLVRSEPNLDLTQHAVVDVDHAPPGDGRRIDIEAGKASCALPA